MVDDPKGSGLPGGMPVGRPELVPTRDPNAAEGMTKDENGRPVYKTPWSWPTQDMNDMQPDGTAGVRSSKSVESSPETPAAE